MKSKSKKNVTIQQTSSSVLLLLSKGEGLRMRFAE